MYDLHDIVLQLSGDLDEANTADFGCCADAAISEHPRRLIVEMSALDTIDDNALSSLAGARERAERAGVAFVLDSANATVTTTLERAGIRESFFIR
jgi:anti-anti-sigma factor